MISLTMLTRFCFVLIIGIVNNYGLLYTHTVLVIIPYSIGVVYHVPLIGIIITSSLLRFPIILSAIMFIYIYIFLECII